MTSILIQSFTTSFSNPYPVTEDWEVTLHFKMSVPKKSRRVSILPESDTIVKDNDLNKSNTELSILTESDTKVKDNDLNKSNTEQENEQEDIFHTKKKYC